MIDVRICRATTATVHRSIVLVPMSIVIDYRAVFRKEPSLLRNLVLRVLLLASVLLVSPTASAGAFTADAAPSADANVSAVAYASGTTAGSVPALQGTLVSAETLLPSGDATSQDDEFIAGCKAFAVAVVFFIAQVRPPQPPPAPPASTCNVSGG